MCVYNLYVCVYTYICIYTYTHMSIRSINLERTRKVAAVAMVSHSGKSPLILSNLVIQSFTSSARIL
jgi:uncharacterized protein with GYD domain